MGHPRILRPVVLTVLTVAGVVTADPRPTPADAGRPTAPFVGAVLTGGGTDNLGAVAFVGPGGGPFSANEAFTQTVLPGGTIRNLRVFLRPIGHVAGSATFTVMINGEETSLTCATSGGPCVAPVEVTILDNAPVTVRLVNGLLSSLEPPEPATLVSFTYSFELL
jgi:hypothetical protein